MSRFQLKRFAEVETLKRVGTTRLLELLRTEEDYFNRRGLNLTEANAGKIDYEQLSKILVTPDVDFPRSLVEPLNIINELATSEWMKSLIDSDITDGTQLTFAEDPTPAEYALALWEANPDLLRRLHTEALIRNRRNFECFELTLGAFPEHATDTNRIDDLEIMLGDSFLKRKQTRWCRVSTFADEDYVWFFIRHGEPVTREPSVDGDEPSIQLFRPQKFDVAYYHFTSGELWINAAATEKKAYQRCLAEFLMGEECECQRTEKYTLEPLRTDGRAALVCSDVPGIEKITLTDVTYQWLGSPIELETRSTDDVFAALENRNRRMPGTPEIARATFAVQFSDSGKTRSVTIIPPGQNRCTRDEDAPLVEEWLQRRRFVRDEFNRLAPKNRFWRALELLPTGAAAQYEWDHLLDGEQPVIAPWLRRRQERASSIRCPRIPACGCRHSIVQHSSSELVAVCQCESRGCATVKVSADELLVLELDFRRLADGISSLLSLDPGLLHHEDFGHSYQIGTFHPQEGFEFPVVLTIASEPDALLEWSSGVVARSDQPTMLVTPTNQHWSPAYRHLAQDQKVGQATLSSLLDITDKGIAVSASAAGVFEQFRRLNVPPSPTEKAAVVFKTPAGAVWSNLLISFPLDDQTVSVNVLGEKGIYYCTDIPGMSSIRNRKPTKQWELLHDFALGRGYFDWDKQEDRKKVEHQIWKLSDIMKEFFRIKGEPIELVTEHKHWKANFRIRLGS